MGGSPSRSSPRDGSSHGRGYGRSRSFGQPAGPPPPQYGGYYCQDPSAGYYAAPQQGGGYAAPYPAPAYQPPAAAPPPPAAKPRQLDRRYSRIADDYHSVDQVRLRLLVLDESYQQLRL